MEESALSLLDNELQQVHLAKIKSTLGFGWLLMRGGQGALLSKLMSRVAVRFFSLRASDGVLQSEHAVKV
jgi:hypothetical protein